MDHCGDRNVSQGERDMRKLCRKNQIVRIVLLGLLLAALAGMGARADWKTTAKGTRYRISKEQGYAKGWAQIEGKWYYFDKKGYLQKSGWTDIDGRRYYLHKKTGERISGRWFRVGKHYYYADQDGVVQRNLWIDGCYIKGNYRRASGWLKLDGATYYMDPQTGKMSKGLQIIDGKTYFFSNAGKMVVKRWKKIGGKYYYLQADGSMAVSMWVGKYQVGSDGARTGKTRCEGLVLSDGKYYYLNSKYAKVSGWVTVDERKYYFGGEEKAALTGLQMIDGQMYYFDEQGVMQTGWQRIDDKTYYFDEQGMMIKDTILQLDGITYEFDADGVCPDSGLGQRIVQFALQFEGNPYVYGGTSLTEGADCSGFTYAVMKQFDIRLPRTADDQRKGKDPYGTYTKSVAVKPNLLQLRPGDLLFYGTKNPKYAGHVALYIGGGKIIHASTEETGIIISSYNYREPIAARRYWT